MTTDRTITNNKDRFKDEPWPEQVGTSVLFDDLKSTIRRFVILSEEQAAAIALWVIHTYFIREPEEEQLFEFSPILFITSPEKQCGKSTLRDCVQRLVCNPFNSMNASQASIFRTIHTQRPTLLLDEFDNFEVDRKSLIGILNSGYEHDGKVTRQGGKNFQETQSFSTWCAKVLAGIGNLPSTLQSRCITIKLRRKFINEKVERKNTVLRSNPSLFEDLRRKIVRFVLEYELELFKTDYVINEDMDDRVQDNWLGLLKLARLIGEDELHEALAAAITLSQPDVEDLSENILLLSDLSIYDPILEGKFVATSELVTYLNGINDRPWSTLGGKGLTGHKLASTLRAFEIKPILERNQGSPTRGYSTSSFRDVFSRYL